MVTNYEVFENCFYKPCSKSKSFPQKSAFVGINLSQKEKKPKTKKAKTGSELFKCLTNVRERTMIYGTRRIVVS